MKRTLLSVIISGFALGTASQAFAGYPTVYGKINVSVQQYDLQNITFPTDPKDSTKTLAKGGTAGKDTQNISIESEASRIGVKGDIDVASGLKAVYQLEYGVKVDDGKGDSASATPFNQRNAFAGLQGAWGTVTAGKIDTPLKTIQTNAILGSDFDRFNDLALADFGQYLAGENRASNIVLYTSPVFAGGIEAKFASVQPEETGVKTAKANNDDADLASGTSASVSYGKSNWYVGLAHDQNVSNTDATRAVGEISVGNLKVGALVQKAEGHAHGDTLTPGSYLLPGSNASISEWDGATAANAFNKQTGHVLNAAYKIAGPWTLKAQAGESKTSPGNTTLAKVDAKARAIGADYKFNDNARVYGYYATLETGGDAKVTDKNTKDKTIGAGLDIKF